MTAAPRLPSYAKLTRQGLELDVSVIPNARRTEVVGLYDGALRVRLHAPPVDGKANDALLRWLAERLGVGRATLQLLRGQTSRRKTVRVDVPATTDIEALLERIAPSSA